MNQFTMEIFVSNKYLADQFFLILQRTYVSLSHKYRQKTNGFSIFLTEAAIFLTKYGWKFIVFLKLYFKV